MGVSEATFHSADPYAEVQFSDFYESAVELDALLDYTWICIKRNRDVLQRKLNQRKSNNAGSTDHSESLYFSRLSASRSFDYMY